MTPYKDIYDRFLRKVSDFTFANLIETFEEELLEGMLYGLLENAIPKFDKCKKDLSNRDENGFLDTLNDYEKDILSSLMVLEWLNPKIYSIENTKQFLGDKDFKHYSQANHLKELISLKKLTENNVNYQINRYIAMNISIEDFKL